MSDIPHRDWNAVITEQDRHRITQELATTRDTPSSAPTPPGLRLTEPVLLGFMSALYHPAKDLAAMCRDLASDWRTLSAENARLEKAMAELRRMAAELNEGLAVAIPAVKQDGEELVRLREENARLRGEVARELEAMRQEFGIPLSLDRLKEITDIRVADRRRTTEALALAREFDRIGRIATDELTDEDVATLQAARVRLAALDAQGGR